MSVDEAAIVADLAAMVAIPSVNTFGITPDAPIEGKMADYYEARLRDLGLEVESQVVADGRRNVWGRLRGSGHGPTVLLAGHMDTVGVDGYDQPFRPRVEAGRVYGRGACDMKAGLACYLEVVRQIKNQNLVLTGDLIIAGVVDEEHAMIGSAAFGHSGPPVDCAIVAEPTSLDISLAHKGQICLALRAKGVSAHSSQPQLGQNAVYHMAGLVGSLRSYAERLQSTTQSICGPATFSVGVIRGGQNASSVPDWCEVEIDRRTIPGETRETIMEELAAIIDAQMQTDPQLQCDILPASLVVPPLNTPETSPVSRAMIAACEDVLGRPAEISAFPGSTDAPNFGCPAVISGPGSLEQCHSLNEYVPIEEIVSAVEIYLRALQLLQTARI